MEKQIVKSEKVTEETLKVFVLNVDVIVQKVKILLPEGFLQPGQTLTTDLDAVIQVKGGYILVDTDCCYKFSDTKLFNGTGFEETFDVPFRVKSINSYPMFPSFLVTIPGKRMIESLSLDKPVSLREFMGKRYNYNPRIISNMKGLLAEVNVIDGKGR